MNADLPPVLILYNLPGDATEFAASDRGVLAEVEAVSAALRSLAIPHRSVGLRSLSDLPAVLAAAPEPLVFNLVEEFRLGPGSPASVPAVCAACGKEPTGGDTPNLFLTLDKWRSKAVLVAAGLPCPVALFIPVGQAVRPRDLPPGPWIVKPVAADASEGIDAHSVVTEPGQKLADAIHAIHHQFHQPALVEQFVGQRELNVSIFERRGQPQVLPLAEIDFSDFGNDRPRIVGYAAKWQSESFEYHHTNRIIPAPLTSRQADRVRQCVLAAWHALGCRDYARVDLRLDQRVAPSIIEVNSNPDISPDAGLAAALAAAKIPYEEFIRTMVENAANRRKKSQEVTENGDTCATVGLPDRANADQRSPQGEPQIRRTLSADRDAILEFMVTTEFFRDDEIEIAREVLDDALAKGHEGHYQSFTAEADGRPAGWVCYGPAPCALGTWDIYWIAVDPRRQSRGLGKALMSFAEREIAARAGRLVIIETNGRESYHPTRAFYLCVGYHEAARVKDFYSPGDDKVVYAKTLST
jgi:D-alanine-D-alanine ligase